MLFLTNAESTKSLVFGRTRTWVEHRTAARISVQTLAGHIRLRLPDRTMELPAGQLLVLDQWVPHDVEAEEDSAFLLTLSWHGRLSDTCETD